MKLSQKTINTIAAAMTAFSVAAVSVPTPALADDDGYVHALKKAFKEGKKNAKPGVGAGSRASLDSGPKLTVVG